MAEQARASYENVVVAEYRLLNALVNNPGNFEDPRVTEYLFVDVQARSLYRALLSLKEIPGVKFTEASVFQAWSARDINASRAIVSSVFSIEQESVETLDDIIPPLKTAQIKDDMIAKLNSLKDSLSLPGEINREYVMSTLFELDKEAAESTLTESPLKTFDEWADEYIEDLDQRKLGRFYTYGDPLLDEEIKKGAYPGAITALAASTSMGKSVFALKLVNNLLERNIPCMYLSLEMSSVDTFDRLIAKRCGFDNSILYSKDANDIDMVIDAVREEKENLRERNNFFFSDRPGLDIVTLRSMIREFKQRTHSDYVFVIIDLLTMLKEFMSTKSNMSVPAAMECGMNSLNELAKSENVHILGVVQLNRDADDKRILTEEDADNIQPTLADIKNSAAIAERCRVVLSLVRPKYYTDKYLNEDGAFDDKEDVLKLAILKNSSGYTGKVLKYLYDGEHFNITPLMSKEDEMMNELELN